MDRRIEVQNKLEVRIRESSVLTGQKKSRHRAVRLRNHPKCFVGVRSVTAQEPESVLQAVLVLLAIDYSDYYTAAVRWERCSDLGGTLT